MPKKPSEFHESDYKKRDHPYPRGNQPLQPGRGLTGTGHPGREDTAVGQLANLSRQGRFMGRPTAADFIDDDNKPPTSLTDKPTETGYQGESRQILTGPNWQTPETTEMIKAIQDKNERERHLYDTPYHIVPLPKLTDIVSRLTPAQARELGHALDMPDFGDKLPEEQVKALANLTWNIFLGPKERIDSGSDHITFNSIRIRRPDTGTQVNDIRYDLGSNISTMLSANYEIQQGVRDNKDKFSDEEAKMICLCLTAGQKIHREILGENGIDPNYYFWTNKHGKLNNDVKTVYDLNERIKISDNIIGSHIIDIRNFSKIHINSLINAFLQFKGELSKYDENTLKQRGKWSLDKIREIIKATINRFTELQQFQGNYAKEAPEIASTMWDKLSELGVQDLGKKTDREIVETYTRRYFSQFTKIHPDALADAFVGWNGKYNKWVENSLVRSGGYSQEDADNIVNAIINKKPGSRDINECENAIKKYMQDDNYSNYGQYIRKYVEIFTPIKTGKLYIEAASDFFESGMLPQRIISLKGAQRLYDTIDIRARIQLVLGSHSQKEQVANREREAEMKGMRILPYIRDSLRGILVLSELCEHGRILPETQDDLRSKGPLSQEATDQLKEAIRLRYNQLDDMTREKFKKFARAKQQTTEDYVKDCLAELRKP